MDWTQEEVPGNTYGLSDSGWMDMQLFKHSFIKHFARHANSAQPLQLLLDIHSLHCNLVACTFAKESGIVMFTYNA